MDPKDSVIMRLTCTSLFLAQMSCTMRKSAFRNCENKGVNQRPLFLLHSSITLFSKCKNFKPLTFFFGCTGRFVSDMIRKLEDMFSHDVTLIPEVPRYELRNIRITSMKKYPLKLPFYIVKLDYTSVCMYIFFLISLQNLGLWILVRKASARQF